MTPLPAGSDTASDRRSSLRVGIDLVSVSDVMASVERFGDQYVRRIFTPHEVDYCRGGGRREETVPAADPCYSYESLAARFAAKEATVKALRPVGARPDWRDIEVHRSRDGWTEIRLFGKAAVLAAEAGIDELAVSLTHEGSTAAAVVVGVCRRGDRSAVQDTTIDRGEV
jgi:holo-[acyl-carrier protein] synthase